MGAYLQERRARASLLSLAVAQAFRQGRERLLATRALNTLRDAARARRLASAAAARIKALRLSRALQVWSVGVRRRSGFRSNVAEKRAAACRMSAFRLSRCLRSWGEKARRGRRQRRALAAAAEALSFSRRRTAIAVWRDSCRRREASGAMATRCVGHLRESTLRRGLRGWRRETFGGGWCEGWREVGRDSAGGGGGRENRVLARLEAVAAAVDAAGGRRRARKALCQWLGHVQGVRRRAEGGR